MRWVLVAMALGCLGGCGPSSTDSAVSSESGLSSPICNEQGTLNADGTETMAGCPFYQQESNIMSHGTLLSAEGKAVTAGFKMAALTVTRRCGPWLLGHDEQGVEIFVHAITGEVRSHGSMHSGEQLSNLTDRLPLPIEILP